MEAYISAWKLGLKAVAIYRDGSKKAQPLSSMGSATAKSQKGDASSSAGVPQGGTNEVEPEDPSAAPPKAVRHRLPDERLSITHKFKVGGHEGYLTVGLYKNGMPGELFITMAKEGSTVSGLMDSFACAISIALQHGVPLKLLCEKFAHTRFEPSGWSNNPDIGYAKSIMDYIFRWLQLRFLTGQQQALFDGLRPKYMGGVAPVSAPDENGYRQILLRCHPEERSESRDPYCRATNRQLSTVRAPAPRRHGHRTPPRSRRAERADRHGRRPQLLRLRRHHDAERKLLPLHELRQHQRVLVVG